jgi:hypothetical protein
VNADRSGSGLGVVEGHGAELVIGAKEVGSEGTSESRPRVWEAQWLGRTMRWEELNWWQEK